MAPVEIGVFIPIGNNGWLISKTSPQYMPTWELNREVVQRAEHHGFDFALSMVKLRGFGGPTAFWDHNLEPFTLMAALAAATTRIRLFASAAVLAVPPAIAARMAVTIDAVAPGRFGLNIVTGWQPAEYAQMGLWPGDAFFGYRYDYASEYVSILRDLWRRGVSDFQGDHFHMDDCRLLPRPSAGDIPVIAAGQSDRGIEFASQHADYNFTVGRGINTPKAFAKASSRLVDAAAATGRDVGSYVLFMIIAEDTDDEAQAKWSRYSDGIDTEAAAWMISQSAKDVEADANSLARNLSIPEGTVSMNVGTLIGSYEKVAAMLDEIAEVPGTKGIMLTFDDFVEGVDKFGEKIQPLMKSRQGRE
ncbi:pyrimidine utilization protein A [Durotheca rogersii]|uniref:pyrimidine utilization protein A n=1 Tax=Durotheca rogersii TaxID=419775 RepID=UPI00222064C0|nr:pyrimidine utilization protein A [Durotheca rogersii]KAI5860026.1 pyrimidine utilization protein A [Durotheca rogersii]